MSSSFGRDRGELEPLLDDLDTDEEDRRDLLLTHALLAQIAEGAELIERVERRALDVLGERILFSQTFRPHDARDRRGTRKPLLLDQELKRPITPSASGNFEHAGFRALVIKNRPHGETLKERAPRDILREFLDRDARLDAADIGLAQHQFVERNVTRLTERNLLNRFRHQTFSATGDPEPLSGPPDPSRSRAPPSSSGGRRRVQKRRLESWAKIRRDGDRSQATRSSSFFARASRSSRAS